MGFDLLGGLFFALLTPMVLLGFGAFWWATGRERAAIEDSWERYAAARAREYAPARGEWPNRTSPVVRWSDDGVAFDLTIVGLEGGARTRLSARPCGRLLGAFEIRAGAAEPLAVSEQPVGLTTRVLDAPTRRALRGFLQHDDVTLRYRRGRLVLEWPGRESNDARIDEAVGVVRALVRRVDGAFLSAARSTPAA